MSEGEGTFDEPGVDTGSIESSMTTVSPYARFALTERVSAWGLAGWGADDMTIVQDARDATETQPARERQETRADLSMRMGAAGAPGALLTRDEAGGMDLALKAGRDVRAHGVGEGAGLGGDAGRHRAGCA